jgi:hypothetical protein
MGWFRKRPPPPPPRLNTLVAYNHIADALEAECRAMGLPGDKFVLVGAYTVEALEPSDVVYDLRRTQDAVGAGCLGAGLN